MEKQGMKHGVGRYPQGSTSSGETSVMWICSGYSGLWPTGRASAGSVSGRDTLLVLAGVGPVTCGEGGCAAAPWKVAATRACMSGRRTRD